jgi:hypothetical protein
MQCGRPGRQCWDGSWTWLTRPSSFHHIGWNGCTTYWLAYQRITMTKKWQQIKVKLRSVALAVPGTRGFFCLLEEALRHKTNGGTMMSLGRHVRAFLEDFRWLADDVATQPTSMIEVIPSPAPATYGACNASGKEMGVLHFVPDIDGDIQPYLWRSLFPLKVARKIIATVNPVRKINNSDLELVGSVAQHNILSQLVDLQDITIHNCCKNTSTVYWQRKGLATTTGPAAYLLRLQTIHQCHYGYAPLHDYIPGEFHLMVDVASRSGNLTDLELIAFFESKFPQTLPWKLCQLHNPMSSALTCALLMRRSKPESLFSAPKPRTSIGSAGVTFALAIESTHSCGLGRNQSPSDKSLDSDTTTVALPPQERRPS